MNVSSVKYLAAALFATLAIAALAFAGVPQTISYQGYLKDAATGAPASGQVSMTFSLYSSATPRNNPVWVEPVKQVTVTNGIYSTTIGSATNPITAPFDVRYYLGVKVGTDEEMALQPLSSVPYAMRASVADTVVGGSIGTSGIADSSVTSAKIANGAVTDLQITGPITAAKLDLSSVQKKYGKVAVVANSGGDYTSPVTAMNERSVWCGIPSAGNPCLVRIMPGVYDLAGEILAMQPYIDIEGSGERGTVISSAVGTLALPPSGVIAGANNAEISRMTIKNSGNSAYAAGIINVAASPVISRVTIVATGGSSGNYGIYNQSATNVVMDSMTISATGGANSSYGIYNTSSSNAAMKNITVSASDSVTINCGVFNNNSVSPAMNSMTVRASGGTNSYAVSNTNSSPVMNNISAVAAGQTASYAVYNSNSSPLMQNVTASTEAGTNGYGIYNYGASEPVMVNVEAGALYSTYNYGMYNSAISGTYSITIDRSSFTGAAYSIFNDGEYTLRIGGSKLTGPANNLGNIVYLASYTDSTPINSPVVGTQSIQTGTDASMGLIVKANSATQSANLQEWQDSNGTAVASVSAAGLFVGDGSGLSGVRIKHGRVAVVAKSGGDYTNPVTAMNDRAAWCSAPSAVNPCLLKIMPGTYDLAGGTLAMQQYIDIEGSGENTTIITSAVGTEALPPAATVTGANDAEIRALTIKNTGANLYGAGMLINAASPRLQQVTLTKTGAGNSNYGLYISTSMAASLNNVTVSASGAGFASIGIFSGNSIPILNNVTVSAMGADLSNRALQIEASSPIISNCTFTATGGIGAHGIFVDSSVLSMISTTVKATKGGGMSDSAYGMYITATTGTRTITIDRSSIEGSDRSVNLASSADFSYSVYIGGSKLTGPVSADLGNPVSNPNYLFCVQTYSGTYWTLDGSCNE